MNKLLIILSLFFTTISYSQTTDTAQVFNDEWYQSLDEPVNFITYRRPCEETIQFRIYRGQEETYTVTITNNNGVVVYKGELNPVDEINISHLYHGIYKITTLDSVGNSITKELLIS